MVANRKSGEAPITGTRSSGPEPEPAFFISSARQDERYVRELASQLRRWDLPVWSRQDAIWGDKPEQLAFKHISTALGMIVVMSPAATVSDVVDRDVSKGLELDRAFRPILLNGDRLFLLTSTYYYDATDGSLPGDAEMRDLRALAELAMAGRFEHREPPAPAAPISGWAQGRDVPFVEVLNPQRPEVSLAQLRHHLREKELANADIITTSILLTAAGRFSDFWLREQDVAIIPSGLLDEIDDAWTELTSGDYGFLAQLRMRPEPPSGYSAGSYRDFATLAEALGWMNGSLQSEIRYNQFLRSRDWKTGFFPTFRYKQAEDRSRWPERWENSATAMHARLREWGKGRWQRSG
jgi:hypothetical protein